MSSLLLLTLLLCAPAGIIALSTITKVVVVGASRSVGLEVFKKLLKSKKSVDVVGIVRSKWSARALRRIGATPEQIRVADIRDKDAVKAAFSGISNCKVVMCTGSKTRRKLFSLAKAAVWKVALKDYKVKPKDLYYRDGERPYVYDYGGTKNCVDAALTARCEQFVLLSCMGGYRQTDMNDIGRNPSDDDKYGNVFKWKRAGQRYLMKRLFFTIIHCGLLTNEKGAQKEIVWDTDDALLRSGLRKISKEDAAEVLVQALLWKEAIGRSIDVASKPLGVSAQGAGPTKDWLRFWSIPGDNTYPAVDT